MHTIVKYNGWIDKNGNLFKTMHLGPLGIVFTAHKPKAIEHDRAEVEAWIKEDSIVANRFEIVAERDDLAPGTHDFVDDDTPKREKVVAKGPSVNGKSKARLQKMATEEGVEFNTKTTIEELKQLILAKRANPEETKE